MSEIENISPTEKVLVERKEYHPGNFKEQLKDLNNPKLLKYVFVPFYRDEEIDKKDYLLNRLESKRSFISKLNNPLTKLGIFIVFIIGLLAVFPSWISTYNRAEVAGVYDVFYQPPDMNHPLGTSIFGRDVLGRLIWGARTSITVGLTSIIISCSLGVLVGIFAAYQGGWLDNIIMRLIDIIMAFPGLILIVIVISILGPEMQYILMVYGFLGIPGYSRLVRGSALQEKNRTYVEAAKVSGANSWQIMFKHILPNCIAPVIVAFSFDIGGIILSLAGLSFLGFGDNRLVEWGYDINQGRRHLGDAPWSAIWPGVGILFTVLGFMLVGDGLRDALDPRLQSKH
ncbi:MAG: ABC transporter permease [Promethearchaeota archaeon]